jgi:hypothetical protein
MAISIQDHKVPHHREDHLQALPTRGVQAAVVQPTVVREVQAEAPTQLHRVAVLPNHTLLLQEVVQEVHPVDHTRVEEAAAEAAVVADQVADVKIRCSLEF